MSYIVLARKYRPQSFAEVYAQDHVTNTCKAPYPWDGLPMHTCFTGPRGVGKTSMARLMAKAELRERPYHRSL
jgi:DNA polymerase-3 subunit gamma/tau